MSSIVMYPHGGSGNHGCEAIVRTTVQLLRGNDLTLFSENPEEDRKYLKDVACKIMKPGKQINRFSFNYVKAVFENRKGNSGAFDELFYNPILSCCNKDTILLSIGGDNYCYGDNELIYFVNKCVRSKGSQTVLWGCSIEPERMTEKMIEDLKQYDMIVARESISYEVLKMINKNTFLKPDPAFLLGQDSSQFPSELESTKYIGINISPMIQSNEKVGGITFDNYRRLMDYILENTDDKIALIPHVVWSHNDDRLPLRRLFDAYSESGRVVLIGDCNCMQLKSVIANSRLFVGARTHSTIAAYSSQVPTLVVGYSNKAKGIATDIFGTYKNYVIPVQSLKTQEDLVEAFKWLLSKENEIQQHLRDFMPDYIIKANTAGELLEGIL